MLVYLRVLKESFRFAINALINNKLRTFLSLLGVTVGIFSIIGVLMAVDSLDKQIRDSLNSLNDSSVIMVHISFGPTEIPRWRREQFPLVTYDDYQTIIREVPNLKAASYTINIPRQRVRAGEETVERVKIDNSTEGLYEIENLNLEYGRYFTEQESVNGANVVVLGSMLRDQLFGEGADPVGKQIRTLSRKLTVIGVLKKQGSGSIFGTKDETAIVPVNVVRRIYGDNNRSTFPTITFAPERDADYDEFLAIAEQKLRQSRGIKYGEVSDFFLNQLKGFASVIEGLIGFLTGIGWGVGAFSLLVGGFGIANIMFVSVRERTNLIGVQKALGAKRRFILYQFLFESVLLSIFGGLIGIFFVWLISIGLNASGIAEGFDFVLSVNNVILGVSVTFVIGLVAGIVPAIAAARLDPVEAIRTGM